MLFDLRGRRRRAVQATYLTLALLMGGGLVFFGIGGDVSGGLFDAFSERGGSEDSGNEALEKRVQRNQARARAGSEAATKELVRDYYQLATSQTKANQAGFPPAARDELANAGKWWNRYLASEPKKPDSSLAAVALQIFDPAALNKPKDAQEAARIVAEADNDAPAYLRLVQYSALAGDTRTADLAAQKAVDLAPKAQRKEVKRQAEQLKKPQSQPQVQGG